MPPPHRRPPSPSFPTPSPLLYSHDRPERGGVRQAPTVGPAFRLDASTSTLPCPECVREPRTTSYQGASRWTDAVGPRGRRDGDGDRTRTRPTKRKTRIAATSGSAAIVLATTFPSLATASPTSPFTSSRQFDKSPVLLSGLDDPSTPPTVGTPTQPLLLVARDLLPPAPFLQPHSKRSAGQRALIEPWSQVDGVWVPQSTWTLFGREVTPTGISPPPKSSSDATSDQVLMEDSVPFEATATASPAALAASASSSSSPSPTPTPTFSVPSGWTAPVRQTNFYAVPVIIATSVILASIVIISIIVTVVWRRKQRRRRGSRAVDQAEKGGSRQTLKARMSSAVTNLGRRRRKKPLPAEGSTHSSDGTSSRGSGGGGGREGTRLGLRRRRGPRARGAGSRRADPEGDESEGTAPLTRSVPSSPLANSLTARITSRLRSTPPDTSNPSTVFSRDLLDRSATRSSLASSQPSLSRTSLSRTSSIASYHSQRDSDGNLGQPADATSPRPHRTSTSGSTFGGVFGNLDILPAPGPPAYRPNSSTIQATTRLTQSILSSPAARSPRPPAPAEEEWHWPNEKSVPVPSSSRAVLTSDRLEEIPYGQEEEEEAQEEPPALERSTYAAHLATDDKEVLARLRAREEPEVDFSNATLAGASAPIVEDDDVDEEGFERFEIVAAEASGSGSRIPAPVGLLPLPPRRVDTSFDYVSPRPTPSSLSSPAPPPVRNGKAAEARDGVRSDSADIDTLPLYLPRPDIVDASAPPEEDDEGADLEGSGEVLGSSASQESGPTHGTGRLEHAVV